MSQPNQAPKKQDPEGLQSLVGDSFEDVGAHLARVVRLFTDNRVSSLLKGVTAIAGIGYALNPWDAPTPVDDMVVLLLLTYVFTYTIWFIHPELAEEYRIYPFWDMEPEEDEADEAAEPEQEESVPPESPPPAEDTNMIDGVLTDPPGAPETQQPDPLFE